MKVSVGQVALINVHLTLADVDEIISALGENHILSSELMRAAEKAEGREPELPEVKI